jgi:hypothetical protein
MEYVKEGHYVPVPVLDPEIGIEYELFARRRTIDGEPHSAHSARTRIKKVTLMI